MIEERTITITRTVFFVVCSKCSAVGPDAVDKHDAREMAIDAGWTFRTIYPSGVMVEVYTCPEHEQQVRND